MRVSNNSFEARASMNDRTFKARLAGFRPAELLIFVITVTIANLIVIAAIGQFSWRMVLGVLLATLAATSLSVAVRARLELQWARRRRAAALAALDETMRATRLRVEGHGSPRDEAALDAELARLRHLELVRHGFA
jgi:hypothetical protein